MLFGAGLVYALHGLGTKILGSGGPIVICLLNIVVLQEFIGVPFAAFLSTRHGLAVPLGIKVVMKTLETIACAALLYFISLSQNGVALTMAFFSILSFATGLGIGFRRWIEQLFRP
jgi:hypothetical protein